MALFAGGIRPLKFQWKGVTCRVRRVTCRWTGRDGDARISCFAVTDGATPFEIACDHKSAGWTMERVEA
ncbi:MAG TPA: hypothetical protein ENJ37_01105 [Deltaproteobacteria bacterium]|nr:hypothetical protein [Deltaproteobacteria bacterium]